MCVCVFVCVFTMPVNYDFSIHVTHLLHEMWTKRALNRFIDYPYIELNVKCVSVLRFVALILIELNRFGCE